MGGNRLHACYPSLDRLFGAFAKTPDIIGNGNAFHNRPMQWCALAIVMLDHGFAFADRLAGPDLTRLEIMQGTHNFMGPRLPDMIQADRILRAKPTP